MNSIPFSQLNRALKRPLFALVALFVAIGGIIAPTQTYGDTVSAQIVRFNLTINSGQALEFLPGDSGVDQASIYNYGALQGDGNFQIGTGNWGNVYQNSGYFNVYDFLSIGRYVGSSGYLQVNDGTVNANNHSIIVGEDGSGNMTIYGGRVNSPGVVLGAASGSYGQLNLNRGTLAVGGITKGSGSADLIFRGGTVLANQGNWDFISGLNSAAINSGGAVIDNGGYSIGINQSLSGIDGANFYGSAWTTLRQNNIYSGDTVVNSGVLDFYESGSLYDNGTAAGNIYVQSGATMNLNRQDIFGNADTGSSSPVTITVNGGLIQNGGWFNNLNNLTLNGGELRANGGGDGGWNAYELNNVTVGGTNASSITANTSINSNNTILLSRAGTTTFNIGSTGDARGDLLVSASLSDGNGVVGSLTKTGLGTMVLSGSNSYTGTTTVASGVLDFVNANSLYSGTAGSWTASNITVSNGATLALGVGGSNSFTTDNVATIITNLSGTDGKGFLAGSSIGFDTTAGNFTATNNFADSVNGSLGLWVFGGNTLTVTGSNSNSGTTTLSGGTLQIGNGGSSGTLGVGNVVDNGTLIFNRAGSSIFANVISGSGALVQGGSGTTILTGSNTYSGGTIISSGGTLQVGNGGTLGTLGTGSMTLNGTLAFNSSSSITVSDTISGSGSLAQNGAGTLTLSGTNTYTGGTIVNAGTIALGASGVGTITTMANIGSSTITVNNGGTLQFTTGNVFGWHTTTVLAPIVANAGGTVGIDSEVYDIVGPIHLNGGTLRSLGSNSFSGFALKGDVSVNGGTNVSTISGTGFTLGAADVTGTIFNVASGGTASGVDLLVSANIYDGAAPAWHPNTQASYLTKTGAGTMLLSGSNTYTGTTTISAGTLQVGNGGTSGTLGSGAVVNNASLVFNRSDNYGGSISNAISGSGSLTVKGGSLNLTASNSYTGITRVQGGTLAVNGSIAGGLQVDAGATLGGSGTIGGNAVISGTHSPGNSPGIQNFGGNLTYQPGATMLWQLADNTTSNSPLAYDQVIVAGNLAFNGGTTLQLSFNDVGSLVNWTDSLWSADQSWTIYQVSGLTTGLSNFTIADYSSLLDASGNSFATSLAGTSFSISQNGQDVVLNYNAQAVPEPSTYALFGLGALVLVVAYRRRIA